MIFSGNLSTFFDRFVISEFLALKSLIKIPGGGRKRTIWSLLVGFLLEWPHMQENNGFRAFKYDDKKLKISREAFLCW